MDVKGVKGRTMLDRFGSKSLANFARFNERRDHRTSGTLAWASGILLLAVALGAFSTHGIQDHVDAQAYHN